MHNCMQVTLSQTLILTTYVANMLLINITQYLNV